MAKAKKTGDTVSSRLALVMKSGKGWPNSHLRSRKSLTEDSHHGHQIHLQDPPLWKGQADPDCRKLPATAQVRARVLRHAYVAIPHSPELKTTATANSTQWPRPPSTTSVATTYVSRLPFHNPSAKEPLGGSGEKEVARRWGLDRIAIRSGPRRAPLLDEGVYAGISNVN